MAMYYPSDLEMAYSAADIRKIHRSGKVASLIGIEGGHQINNSIAVLRQMYDLGARYMTLTNSSNRVDGFRDRRAYAPRLDTVRRRNRA
jgi:membrane dipeptidase